MKKIAIIGSSGGNLYSLGGKKPEKLLEEIITQSSSADIKVGAIQFIAAEESMDSAKDNVRARIFSQRSQEQPEVSFEGSLEEVNQEAAQFDKYIAEQIHDERIDGLIVMSSDPDGVNRLTIEAAADKQIPIVGTGGTSMAMIGSKGAMVISQSGTTGTTSRTRAVSFTASLAKYWNMAYQPVIGSQSQIESGSPTNVFKNISLRGIMVSALPGFIAMAIVLALSRIPIFSGLGEVFDIMIQALPVVLAAIAAKQVSDLDEVSIAAGVIAGVLSVEGGIIGGIIGGILAGIFVHYLFRKCVQWRFPMTTVNIVAGGLSGLAAGLIVYYLLAPIALQTGNGIKTVIESAIAFNPIMAGALAGLLIWPAILGGVYHAAILPIVLLEMETAGNSFLGAIDMVGLVMVSAGITLANVISPRDKGEAAAAAPGFLINMGFGTFVEAAYPFMFSNKFVFAGAILSAGAGGALVGLFNVRGTAYVPTFAAPLLTNNAAGFIIAMAVAFILAFVITISANRVSSSKKAG